MNSFWMCYVEGQRGPTFKHTSISAAKQEAERLARLNPNATVYVLQAVEKCEAISVQWTPMGIPF